MKRNQRGFTILEVLIAIVILGVAMFALSKLQTASIGSNYNSRRTSIATILAQDKMEELMNLSYTDSQLTDTENNWGNNEFDWSRDKDHDNSDGPSGAANPIDENGNSLAEGSAGGYNRYWNVVDNVPTTNMKTIAVRIEWTDKSTHSVTIDTVVSK